MLLKPFPHFYRTAIDRISRYPVERHTCLSCTLKLSQGQLPFGAIWHIVCNASFSAALAIIDPVFWQIQIAVNEGMSACGDIGQHDCHLAVLSSPSRPTMLFFDSG